MSTLTNICEDHENILKSCPIDIYEMSDVWYNSPSMLTDKQKMWLIKIHPEEVNNLEFRLTQNQKIIYEYLIDCNDVIFLSDLIDDVKNINSILSEIYHLTQYVKRYKYCTLQQIYSNYISENYLN